MEDLVVGLGIALVIEGVFYALMPDGMKRLMSVALTQPSGRLRMAGLALAIAGVLLVALIRG
jgi:uncharacterized protein YjeT (DUF2065 family)